MRTALTLELEDGTAIGYAEYGDSGGIPLVYFHGWPGSRLQAKIIDEPARRRGIRVLAPDRPGIGLSSPAPVCSVRQWTETVRRFADASGIDRFLVLGVSGGGPYALACGFAMPERILAAGACCSAPPLSLIGDVSGLHWLYRLLIAIDSRSPRLAVLLMAFTRLYVLGLPKAFVLMPLIALLPGPDRRAMGRPEYLLPIAEAVQEAYRQGTVHVIRDARRIRDPWGFDLGKIPLAFHFWHGCRDRNIPIEMVRLISRRVPKAVEHIYEHDGHYSLPLLRSGAILDDLLSAGRE